MSMVAEAARVLGQVRYGRPETLGYDVWDQLSKQDRRDLLIEAKAVIGTLADPSEAMKVTGGLAFEKASFEEGKIVFEAVGDAFQAMISDALNAP